MLQEQVKEYVSLGSAFKEDEKLYRTQCFVPLVFALIGGMVPGAILGGFWPFLLIVMLIVSVACVITTFKLSSYGLTLQDALCLDAFIYGTWVLNLSILELMYFVMWKGFTPWLLLMYLPVMCIPLFVGMRIHILLKKKIYSKKRTAKSSATAVGFGAGMAGMSFAAIFRNAEQSTVIVVVLVCFVILSSLMSLGLLSLHKLYFIKKYQMNL